MARTGQCIVTVRWRTNCLVCPSPAAFANG
jgi:hypothetical protein